MNFLYIFSANREFIEQRRKSLRRFLNLVARHPKMYDDKLVKFFLTFIGCRSITKIKHSNGVLFVCLLEVLHDRDNFTVIS